ncbi:T6SS immunity protein Tdi1 domain-containing protein [Kribbella sp. NPDC051936]|uniref:T6SS immunity protein Tdi1 domain-containing protein n=1 Tax=Kribbella sp. NPDC051936 TaxID=3154946 RepID=UPI0034183B9A
MSENMLERFSAAFEVTAGPPKSLAAVAAGTGAHGIRAQLGGCTFEHGLYRIHTDVSAAAAGELVDAAFPEFTGRFESFGFDWLGRQFAVDRQRGRSADPEVMMIEPGTGEALEIPVPVSRFHDEELVDYPEAALARGFHSEWVAACGPSLRFDQCVGYRVPLFLGGADELDNLEVSDLEVYWDLMGQLRLKVIGSSAEGIAE